MKNTQWKATEPGRLDHTVKRLAELSNKKARLAVFTGKVTLNGTRCQDGATPVAVGDTISLSMAAPNPARTEPFGAKLVHRDAHLIVLNKPAGLLSAPIPNSEDPTALKAAQQLCRGGRPAKVVHRLDKLTSGLMVFARGTNAARALRQQMDQRMVHRVYRCVVRGTPRRQEAMLASMLLGDAGEGRSGSRQGTFKVMPPHGQDPDPMDGSGKHAVTRYRVLASENGLSALEVKLSTGRTHQIRIHLSELGHPILGETVYSRTPKGSHRQALHSATLALIHPVTGKELQFKAPWPHDLREVSPIGPDW